MIQRLRYKIITVITIFPLPKLNYHPFKILKNRHALSNGEEVSDHFHFCDNCLFQYNKLVNGNDFIYTVQIIK